MWLWSALSAAPISKFNQTSLWTPSLSPRSVPKLRASTRHLIFLNWELLQRMFLDRHQSPTFCHPCLSLIFQPTRLPPYRLKRVLASIHTCLRHPTGSTSQRASTSIFCRRFPPRQRPQTLANITRILNSFVFPSPQLPGADEFPNPGLDPSSREQSGRISSGMPSIEPAYAVTDEPEEEVVFDFIPDSQTVAATSFSPQTSMNHSLP